MLARALGPDGRGLLLALTFWPALFAAILNLSLNEALTYHLAKHSGTLLEPQVSSAAFQLVVITIVVSMAITVLSLWTIIAPLQNQYANLMIAYALVFIPISYLEQFFRAILQGRGALLTLNAVRVVQPISNFTLLIFLLIFGLLDVATAMAATVGSLFVSLILGAAVTRPAVSQFNAQKRRNIAATGWQFHRANLLFYVSSEVDKLIVLVLLTPSQVGLFAVAIAVSTIGTGVVLQSLGLMLMRDIVSAEDEAGRRRVFIVNMRATFAMLALFNGIAAALTPWAIPALYGAPFAVAVPAIILFLGAGALKGARQMIDRGLRASHHTRTGMIGEIVFLTGLMLFGWIGAATAGLEGFALGTLVAQAAAFVVVLPLASSTLGVRLLDLWPFQKSAIEDISALLFRATMPPTAP